MSELREYVDTLATAEGLNVELTLDELITMLAEQRAEITAIEKQVKKLKSIRHKTEFKIMDAMAAQGLQKAGGDSATVSVKEEVVPVVDPEHWEDVWQYLFENGLTSLLYRRLLSSGWKELENLGESIPHVTGQTITKLNFSSSKK